MKNKIFSLLLFVLFLVSLSFADEMVLQNGSNGYEGCKDTHLSIIVGSGQFLNDNYHSEIATTTAT